MAIDTFFVHPVTIITPGTTTDRYNNTVDDWGVGATEVDENWWVNQLSSFEQLGNRDTTVTSMIGFAPKESTISPISRVRIDGTVYEVDGAPKEAKTPSGVHHIEVILKLPDDVRVT